MKISRKPSLATIATAVVVFNFASCKYEDGPKISLRTKTARLTGEWEATYIAGEKVPSELNYIVEFEKGGDLIVTYSYNYYGQSYSESYKGEWEWQNGKETIEISLDGSKEDWDVTRLTNKELEFEDSDRDTYEFEKI